MTAVQHLPDHGMREAVASDIRAALSRARIRVVHLPRLLGKSNSYWSRRVNGELPFDIDDLEALAGLLHCRVALGLVPTDDSHPPDRTGKTLTDLYPPVWLAA